MTGMNKKYLDLNSRVSEDRTIRAPVVGLRPIASPELLWVPLRPARRHRSCTRKSRQKERSHENLRAYEVPNKILSNSSYSRKASGEII